MSEEYVHLENDGKILLVDENGEGPKIPQMGRVGFETTERIRLPTVSEAKSMGIIWKERRVNRITLGVQDFIVIYGMPEISWPEHWAWKDAVISDSAVDPLARESVYRTLHRVVSKVVISNSNRTY